MALLGESFALESCVCFEGIVADWDWPTQLIGPDILIRPADDASWTRRSHPPWLSDLDT